VTLPPLDGLVHLAVASGCGGTTLGLQCVRAALESDGRAIWVSLEPPNPERFRQLLQSIPLSTLSKLHLFPCGESVFTGVEAAGKLCGTLDTRLIVIDDWTPRSGHIDPMAASAIGELVKSLPENAPEILVISSLYEDASGKDTWKVRGRAKLEELGFQTWMLTVDETGHQRRTIDNGNGQLPFLLEDNGFNSRAHSSSSSNP